MTQDDQARAVDVLTKWKAPEGVSSKVSVFTYPNGHRVKIVLTVSDYSVAMDLIRPPREADLQRLTMLAGELLDWAADEVVSIAGHEWN
jgi:predicted transcriptional regulator